MTEGVVGVVGGGGVHPRHMAYPGSACVHASKAANDGPLSCGTMMTADSPPSGPYFSLVVLGPFLEDDFCGTVVGGSSMEVYGAHGANAARVHSLFDMLLACSQPTQRTVRVGRATKPVPMGEPPDLFWVYTVGIGRMLLVGVRTAEWAYLWSDCIQKRLRASMKQQAQATRVLPTDTAVTGTSGSISGTSGSRIIEWMNACMCRLSPAFGSEGSPFIDPSITYLVECTTEAITAHTLPGFPAGADGKDNPNPSGLMGPAAEIDPVDHINQHTLDEMTSANGGSLGTMRACIWIGLHWSSVLSKAAMAHLLQGPNGDLLLPWCGPVVDGYEDDVARIIDDTNTIYWSRMPVSPLVSACRVNLDALATAAIFPTVVPPAQLIRQAYSSMKPVAAAVEGMRDDRMFFHILTRTPVAVDPDTGYPLPETEADDPAATTLVLPHPSVVVIPWDGVSAAHSDPMMPYLADIATQLRVVKAECEQDPINGASILREATIDGIVHALDSMASNARDTPDVPMIATQNVLAFIRQRGFGFIPYEKMPTSDLGALYAAEAMWLHKLGCLCHETKPTICIFLSMMINWSTDNGGPHPVITGQPGCGKTWLLQMLKQVLCVETFNGFAKYGLMKEDIIRKLSYILINLEDVTAEVIINGKQTLLNLMGKQTDGSRARDGTFSKSGGDKGGKLPVSPTVVMTSNNTIQSLADAAEELGNCFGSGGSVGGKKRGGGTAAVADSSAALAEMYGGTSVGIANRPALVSRSLQNTVPIPSSLGFDTRGREQGPSYMARSNPAGDELRFLNDSCLDIGLLIRSGIVPMPYSPEQKVLINRILDVYHGQTHAKTDTRVYEAMTNMGIMTCLRRRFYLMGMCGERPSTSTREFAKVIYDVVMGAVPTQQDICAGVALVLETEYTATRTDSIELEKVGLSLKEENIHLAQNGFFVAISSFPAVAHDSHLTADGIEAQLRVLMRIVSPSSGVPAVRSWNKEGVAGFIIDKTYFLKNAILGRSRPIDKAIVEACRLAEIEARTAPPPLGSHARVHRDQAAELTDARWAYRVQLPAFIRHLRARVAAEALFHRDLFAGRVNELIAILQFTGAVRLCNTPDETAVSLLPVHTVLDPYTNLDTRTVDALGRGLACILLSREYVDAALTGHKTNCTTDIGAAIVAAATTPGRMILPIPDPDSYRFAMEVDVPAGKPRLEVEYNVMATWENPPRMLQIHVDDAGIPRDTTFAEFYVVQRLQEHALIYTHMPDDNDDMGDVAHGTYDEVCQLFTTVGFHETTIRPHTSTLPSYTQFKQNNNLTGVDIVRLRNAQFYAARSEMVTELKRRRQSASTDSTPPQTPRQQIEPLQQQHDAQLAPMHEDQSEEPVDMQLPW